MEVFVPSISLIIWTLLVLTSFGIGIVALTRLYRNNQLDSMSKIIWTIWILFIPIFGVLLYYVICELANRRSNS